MLTDPLGPLAIRWSYLPQLSPWLFHFLRASTPARVEAVSIALRALLKGAMTAYDTLLAAAGIRDMIRRSGWVCVYATEAAYHGDRSKLHLQHQRGARLEVLRQGHLGPPEPGPPP